MSAESITFLASFPPIQSAIKVAGNGDGMRIQLDIPETEMAKAAYLLAMREMRLEITVKPLLNSKDQDNDVEKGTKW